MKIKILFFLVAALTASAVTHAQDKSNDTTAQYFIIQASIANNQEVAIGKLAAEKAVSPEVKDFAKRMSADHSTAEAKLLNLIRSKGFQIPREATDLPVEDLMLRNTATKDFDRAYVHMMVAGHGQTVALFEKYAITGKDPIVKAYAQEMLPILKEHLDAVNAINDNMKYATAH